MPSLSMLAVECLEQIQNFIPVFPVEIARRLIAEQQRGIGDNSTGDAHTLLLAARELARIMQGAMGKPNHPKGGLHVLLALGPLEVGEKQRQFDVTLGGQHRDEIIKLENKSNVPRSPGRQPPVWQLIGASPAN